MMMAIGITDCYEFADHCNHPNAAAMMRKWVEGHIHHTIMMFLFNDIVHIYHGMAPISI